MNVKHSEAVHLDVSVILRQLVQLRFNFPPVEFIFPVRNKPLHLFGWDAEIPTVLICGLKLRRELGPGETLLQFLQSLVRDRYCVRLRLTGHDEKTF